MQTRNLIEAARAARRFQLIANFHLSKPCAARLQEDGQALCDLLADLGFTPSPDASAPPHR